MVFVKIVKKKKKSDGFILYRLSNFNSMDNNNIEVIWNHL